jgi:acyl-CoA synthetase (NDP forming)
MQALFAPRAVALVGASGDAAKNTARPQRFLKKHGYAGRVYPVNPGRSAIFDAPCFPRVSEIPGAVDHALIMIDDVEGALEDCGKRGVKVASIYANGFADAGPAGE